MHLEYRFSSQQVRQLYRHAPVESSRSCQRRVQRFRSVSGREDYYAGVFLESIHLCEQLVQRLFTLVVSCDTVVTLLSDSVDLVDENYARCFFLGLFEQVADL